MADKKISELPASSALDIDDLLAVVEDGTTVKATIADLLDLAPSGLPEGYAVPPFTPSVGTDQTTTMTAAINELATTGGTVLIPEGTFYSQILVASHSGVTFRGTGVASTTIVAPTAGLIISTSGTPRGGYTFEDITFDLDGTATGAMVVDLADLGVTFRRCRFINITGYGVYTNGAVGTVFEDCEFDCGGLAVGTAVLCAKGTRGLRWIRSKARFMAAGLQFDDAPHDDIDVDGGLFDGGWYLLPTRSGGYTNSGGTVTYSSTGLTDSAASFGAIPTPFDVNVRALPVLESGSTGTTYVGTYVDDSTATFATALVKPGHIVRTSTKWAVVARVVSETRLYVEEWFDSTTYRPTAPPAAATAYNVYRVLIGLVDSNTGTTITIERWVDFHDGASVTPAAGTLYEVLINHGEYSGIHAAASDYDATGAIRRIRVHGGCRITRTWNDQLSIFGRDARLVVEPSVIIDHGQDFGITSHGDQARIAGTVVHNGAVNIYSTGADCQIEAFASGAPWVNIINTLWLGDLVISGSRTRASGTVVVASGAHARYGIVIYGATADGPIDAVDVTGTSATGYSVAEYRVYGQSAAMVTDAVLLDVSGTISESNATGTVGPAHPSGTTTVSGILELATSAETITGTDTARATTPASVAAVTGGGILAPGMAGFYYGVPLTGANSTMAPTLNLAYFVRLPRPGGFGISDIGVETVVASAATGLLRFGAYTEVAGMPSVLISDFGTTAADVGAQAFVHKAGTVASGTSPIWLCVVAQTTVTSLQFRSKNQPGTWGVSATLQAGRAEGGYAQASVSGGLPNPAVVSSTTTNQVPIIVGLAS